jgi:ribosome-associated protein
MQDLIHLIKEELDKNKIENIQFFDLSDKGYLVPYMIIGTGTSVKHIASIGEKLSDLIKQNNFVSAIRLEGAAAKSPWIILDLENIMVHLFTQEEREKYQLEELYQASSSRRSPSS